MNKNKMECITRDKGAGGCQERGIKKDSRAYATLEFSGDNSLCHGWRTATVKYRK